MVNLRVISEVEGQNAVALVAKTATTTFLARNLTSFGLLLPLTSTTELRRTKGR